MSPEFRSGRNRARKTTLLAATVGSNAGDRRRSRTTVREYQRTLFREPEYGLTDFLNRVSGVRISPGPPSFVFRLGARRTAQSSNEGALAATRSARQRHPQSSKLVGGTERCRWSELFPTRSRRYGIRPVQTIRRPWPPRPPSIFGPWVLRHGTATGMCCLEWEMKYSADGYCDLLSTYSGHIALSAAAR